MIELVISHSWCVYVIIGLTSAYFNFQLHPAYSPCSLYLSSTFSHPFRALLCLCPSRAWLIVFICIMAALFTLVYLKHTFILDPLYHSLITYCGLQVCISLYLSQYTWLLIVDSILAPRSSLSRPSKWLVCFLNPQPKTCGTWRHVVHRWWCMQSGCISKPSLRLEDLDTAV